MEDGKLYMIECSPDCVFAYCSRGMVSTSFYICVGSIGTIHLSDRHMIYGESGNAPSIPADEHARNRFNTILAQHGYKWNESNKVLFKDGRVLESW